MREKSGAWTDAAVRSTKVAEVYPGLFSWAAFLSRSAARKARLNEEQMKKTARRIFFTIILASLFLSALATAQESAAKRASRVVVHAGKLLDVRSGKTLTDQAIVIEGGKIVSVGPYTQANRGSGDRLIDLSNATVLPGLTDAHTHLTGNPQDAGPQGLGISLPRATLSGAHNARLTLEARLYHGSQRGSRRLQRCRPAGRHRRWRCSRSAHAGEWTSAWHHRRTLR